VIASINPSVTLVNNRYENTFTVFLEFVRRNSNGLLDCVHLVVSQLE